MLTTRPSRLLPTLTLAALWALTLPVGARSAAADARYVSPSREVWPADGAKNVPTNAVVRVVYSEWKAGGLARGALTLRAADGSLVDTELTEETHGVRSVVYLTPRVPLQPSAVYQLRDESSGRREGFDSLCRDPDACRSTGLCCANLPTVSFRTGSGSDLAVPQLKRGSLKVSMVKKGDILVGNDAGSWTHRAELSWDAEVEDDSSSVPGALSYSVYLKRSPTAAPERILSALTKNELVLFRRCQPTSNFTLHAEEPIAGAWLPVGPAGGEPEGELAAPMTIAVHVEEATDPDHQVLLFEHELVLDCEGLRDDLSVYARSRKVELERKDLHFVLPARTITVPAGDNEVGVDNPPDVLIARDGGCTINPSNVRGSLWSLLLLALAAIARLTRRSRP